MASTVDHGFDSSAVFQETEGVDFERAYEFLEYSCSVASRFQATASSLLEAGSPSLFYREYFSSMLILDLLSSSCLSAHVKSHTASYILSSHGNGVFRFFERAEFLPADVDCTALGLAALIRVGEADPEMIDSGCSAVFSNTLSREEIERGLSDGSIDGIYEKVLEAGTIQVYLPPRGGREGRIDPAVGANALSMLRFGGRLEDVRPTLRFVRGVLEHRIYAKGTRYYLSPDAFLYFVARALSMVPALKDELGSLLHDRLLERIGVNDNPLDLAMRVIAARLLGIDNDDEAAKLSAQQTQMGCWPRVGLIRCGRADVALGAESLTTAFALRALDSSLSTGQHRESDPSGSRDDVSCR